ncbi:trimeric intracellular cation channel family protein [Stenotrophomonas sp. SY1]|uniref:trimeric intracellular cation channel family protein n=1 Tax=Stenotrophomonas sp. SY1 TaxID=477235 RepID=UPI001E5B93CF|nr:trimeric intracellular cation channel family protein [Stenotrophomonas sp. SY1]MCD9088289.1 trimeric intracellular cation channel family protein [Stenotrophomonas sp. SY1]
MLLSIIYLIAISAEAMTGALAAGRRRMDLFGVVMIACVTALGGGSLRDILLGHYPLGWVKHPEYLGFTVCAALIATWLARWMHHFRRTFLVLDGLGLIAFTLIGCAIAREAGHAPQIVLIAGMLTGAFGGVLRDILCNEVPLIFQKELYAIISLLTGAAYLLLLHWQVADDTAIVCCLLGGFALRLLAIRYRWEMPKFVYHDELH